MMDMGLDEIIKSKKKRKPFVARKGGVMRGKQQIKPQQGGGRVVDARLKIIEKNRAKLRDARDRLIQLARSTDARNRITPRGQQRNVQTGRNGVMPPGWRGTSDRVSIPRRTIRNQNVGAMTFADRREILYMTVKNSRAVNDEMMITDNDDWTPTRLQVHLHNATPSPAPTPPHHIIPRPTLVSLRSNMCSDESWLRSSQNKQSIYRGREDVKSRLEPVRSGPQIPQPQNEGYRIVVSNLQPTVTHEDIKELFEDIGVLVGSRVVRPGTAEVVYKNMDDALAAVDTYHNRQLDGQPMKCMLVKPSNVSGKGLSGTKGSIVPDLHAIHKALFNK